MKPALISMLPVFLLLLSRVLAAVESAQEPPLTIVNVSSHCDWCWGQTRIWHEQRYAEIIRQVVLMMRDNPKYVWQLETVNEELAPFLEKAQRLWPELIPEFWQRVREGRIEIINAISNPRLTEAYPETLVRNLVLAIEYFRRQAPDVELTAYNSVDLMCGPSQMPQIFAQAGYRYFMFSRPMAPQVVFWRTGLDGTRMLCSRCFYGYDAMGHYGVPVPGFKPVPVWRLAIGADDALPDPKLPQAAAGWDPQRKALATLTRYFDEVAKCGAPITELKGPLDSLECFVEAGLHGDRNLYMHNNQDQDLLLCLEKAQVMALRPGKAGHDAPLPVEPLWREILACTGHAIMWAWTADYDERIQLALHRRARIEQALSETLAAVSRSASFRRDLGAPLLVFNFHSWPVTGPVEFTIEGNPNGLVLSDGAGTGVPIQQTGRSANGEPRMAFVAVAVPACGYKTFYLRGAGSTASSSPPAGPVNTIENDCYRVQLRPDGSLEVFDKVAKTQLGGTAPGGLGELVWADAPPPQEWEMNGPLGARRTWKPAPESFQSVDGAVFSALRATGTFGPHTGTRELRLWHGSRRLDYHLELDAADGCGVFLIRFPLGLAGKAVAGIPFGVEPRENFAQEPFREEFFVKGYPTAYYATRWTDVSSDRLGYTFACPAGANTGYAFDATQQTLEFLLLRVRPLTPGTWGLMHPSIKGTGHHVFDCCLIPHAGSWQDAASYRDALESHVPLLAFSPDLGLRRARTAAVPAKPVSPPSAPQDLFSCLDVDARNVVVSALRLVAPSGGSGRPEVELRLYETTAATADAAIRLALPPRAVRETDFLGNPSHTLDKIEVNGNTIQVRIPPWKIITLRWSQPDE